jgi:predicted nucleic acid-binding protein
MLRAPEEDILIYFCLTPFPDYLITLDKKHFLKRKVQRDVPVEVCTPADFLRIFERFWLQD